MTPLTETVRQKINAIFPAASRETVQKLLEEKCGADLPLTGCFGPDPSAFDRIRFAVLKLSKGDVKSLEREVAAAHVDWRDTLMAAGFGEDLRAHLYWNPKSES
jgi:hypothetical protein